MSTTGDTFPALAGAEKEVYSFPTPQMYIERRTPPIRVEALLYDGTNLADAKKYIGPAFVEWLHEDSPNPRFYTVFIDDCNSGRNFYARLYPGSYLVKFGEGATPAVYSEEEFHDNWVTDEPEESSLVAHARHELEIIGEEQVTINGVLKVIQAYSDMGHSGGSHSIIAPWIAKLLDFKNLTTLTDNPEEWDHISEDRWGSPGGIWQNRRRGEAFSNDGGKTYYLLSEGGNDGNRKPLHKSDEYVKPSASTKENV